MRRDIEPPDQTKQPRKRERDYNPETREPASKHRRISPPALPPAQHEDSLLPTPVLSATSPEQQVDSASQPPQTPSEPTPGKHKLSSRAPSEQERLYCDPPTPKRRRQPAPAPAPEPQPVELQAAKPQHTWFIDFWESKTLQALAAQEKGEEGSDVPAIAPVVQETFEGRDGLPSDAVEGNDNIPIVEGLSDWEDESYQMSLLRDGSGSQAPGSAVSERLKTSSPMYRGTLRMNNVIIDDNGTEMPRDVEELVTRHIRKERKSPRLGNDEKDSMLRNIKLVWNSPESRVTDVMALPLLPFGKLDHAPSLAQGGDILWSRTPLPRNVDYPLVTPKTDKHLGYQPTLSSEWTPQELAAADHPKVRPFSQPTRENLFPSFICEGKSEATGGTPYGAEAQLATAGCHRVNSMRWILSQIDPKRTQKSSDAIVFSAVYTQRQVIAHVHYYDTDDNQFRMSFIDSFYLAKELQGCVDFRKNIEEWLVEIQQPVVREAMREMYPITQLWNKGRPASAMADDVDSSLDSNGARSTKVRMEEVSR